MFGLRIRRRCAYCGMRIERGQEVIKEVEAPGGGTRPRAFCSEEHAAAYQSEGEARPVKGHKGGGGCCG